MGSDIADQLAPIPMSPTLGQTLTRAAQYAQEQSHTEVALDHLLLALTEDEDARQVMASSGVEIAGLQTDVSQQIGRIDARLQPSESPTVTISEELRRVLNAAAVAARAGRRTMIDGAIVLAAIIGDAKTTAAGLLRAHGLTFDVAINVIRQANRPEDAGGGGGPPGSAPSPPHSSGDPGGTNDILANARARVASRRAAGYIDTVGKGSPEPETYQTEAGPSSGSGEETALADEEQTPPPPAPASMDTTSAEHRDVATEPEAYAKETALEDDEPPPPEPSRKPAPSPATGDDESNARPPVPPPPSFRPPPTIDPPPYGSPEPPRGSPQPSTGLPSQGGQGWAPSPSGQSPGAGQRPRGAPPPIPPGMPSRPPAPVTHGPRGTAPPPGQSARRDAPWTGPPTAPPGTGEPLLSPEEVFGANARARQQGERAPPPNLERQDAQPRGSQPTVAPGQLIENVPRRMRVGISSPVEVRIAKAEVKAISDGLDVGRTAHRHDIHVTKAMSVRLRAPEGGFFIETASPETQWIENALGLMADDYARWRWTVTPKARGRRRLQIIVAARTVGPDGLAAETALPEQVIEIKVSANYGALLTRLAGWTVAAVLGGLLARFGAQIWTTLEPLVRSLMQQ